MTVKTSTSMGISDQTIADWLILAMIRLKEAGVKDGRHDALILLSDVLQKDKSWVHAHGEESLSFDQTRRLNFWLKKRCQRIPLAYIRGFKEFYGRNFLVNRHVLIPRPESESFIALLREIDLEMPLIADIGTGSGCLAITTSLEIAEAEVHGYDISPDAIRVARKNAKALGANVRFYQSNLLNDLRGLKYQVIVANLPYVPSNLITSQEITKEPAISLFSGQSGLDHYKEFWQQLHNISTTSNTKPTFILTESLVSQHQKQIKMAKKAGYSLIDTDLLVQMFKAI